MVHLRSRCLRLTSAGSIPLVCCYLGIPLGVVALILGILGRKKADQGLATNRGMAMAGLITGSVGIGLGVVQIILVATIGFGAWSDFQNLDDF